MQLSPVPYTREQAYGAIVGLTLMLLLIISIQLGLLDKLMFEEEELNRIRIELGIK